MEAAFLRYVHDRIVRAAQHVNGIFYPHHQDVIPDCHVKGFAECPAETAAVHVLTFGKHSHIEVGISEISVDPVFCIGHDVFGFVVFARTESDFKHDFECDGQCGKFTFG